MQRLFGTLGLLAVSAMLLPSASAGIILVDPANINVPKTSAGVYVDMVTGATQTFRFLFSARYSHTNDAASSMLSFPE